jgi:hypothetical protein
LKAIKQPDNLNEMYLLANYWVKPVMRGGATGLASTFTTTFNGYMQQSAKTEKKRRKKKAISNSNNNIEPVAVEHWRSLMKEEHR